ncbi:DNA polymerase III subunit delta [Buchnera aphidicola]|uniref:DNA polymerase III subunit delta n=1 Tax=Buchnera aphidicola TaxID=9 RepID=UPI0031B8ACD5
MIYILQYNELEKKIFQKIYHFLIIEQDFFISQKTIKKILFYYCSKEHKVIQIIIKKKNHWENVYFEYRQDKIFDKKKILILILENKKIDYVTITALSKIFKYKNNNIILIIYFKKISNKHNIEIISKKLQKYPIGIIPNPVFTKNELNQWIKKKIKKINLKLNSSIINILSHLYKKNLLFLYKILEGLKIINKKKKITVQLVNQITQNTLNFYISDLIHAIFQKKIIKSCYIIDFLKRNKYDISHIIRSIQIHIIYFIHIKEKKIYDHYLHIFKKYIVLKKEDKDFTKLINDINNTQLYKIINLIYKIEINIKKKNNQLSWYYLKTLTAIFCNISQKK